MNTALVVTSINPPTPILQALAAGARAAGVNFIVAGDTKSPADFALDGCLFLDVEAQRETGFAFADACPTRSYARKNVGYLVAMQRGARVIIETDDDNWPTPAFFEPRSRTCRAPLLTNAGWTNLYRYFTDALIWPRGLPLDAARQEVAPYETLTTASCDAPIQQGLADENPDVDAIYRLLLPLPQSFEHDRRILAGAGTWCPFNSQNTTWWPEAWPLLYLPSYCSFRMTDIWRSFVAQRIAWANGWPILFHGPTVWQERNVHNLMGDFADEVPGYLHNARIADALASLTIRPGVDALADNLRLCYETLVAIHVVGREELALLDRWLSDLRMLAPTVARCA